MEAASNLGTEFVLIYVLIGGNTIRNQETVICSNASVPMSGANGPTGQNVPRAAKLDDSIESKNVMMDRVWKTKIWIDQLKLESVSLDFATGGETGVSGAPVASLV